MLPGPIVPRGVLVACFLLNTMRPSPVRGVPYQCGDSGLSNEQIEECRKKNLFNPQNRATVGVVHGEDLTKAQEDGKILVVHEGGSFLNEFEDPGKTTIKLYDIVVTQSAFEVAMSNNQDMNVEQILGGVDQNGINTRLYVPKGPVSQNTFDYIDEWRKGRQVGQNMENMFDSVYQRKEEHYSPLFPLMRRYPLNEVSLDVEAHSEDQNEPQNMLETNPSASYLEACIAYPQMSQPAQRDIAERWRKYSDNAAQASPDDQCSRDDSTNFCFSYNEQLGGKLPRDENSKRLVFAPAPDVYRYCAQFLPADGCDDTNGEWYKNCLATCYCYTSMRDARNDPANGNINFPFFTVFSRPSTDSMKSGHVSVGRSHSFTETYKYGNVLRNQLKLRADELIPSGARRGFMRIKRVMLCIAPEELGTTRNSKVDEARNNRLPWLYPSLQTSTELAPFYHLEEFAVRVTTTHRKYETPYKEYSHGLIMNQNLLYLGTMSNQAFGMTLPQPILLEVKSAADYIEWIHSKIINSDTSTGGCTASDDASDPYLQVYLNSGTERQPCDFLDDCSNREMCIEAEPGISRCYSCPNIGTEGQASSVRYTTGENCFPHSEPASALFHYCPSSTYCPRGYMCGVKRECTESSSQILNHAICLPESRHDGYVAIETVLLSVELPYPRTRDNRDCDCSSQDCSQGKLQLCVARNGTSASIKSAFTRPPSHKFAKGDPCDMSLDLCGKSVDSNRPGRCMPVAASKCNLPNGCQDVAVYPEDTDDDNLGETERGRACLNFPNVRYPDLSESGDTIACVAWSDVLNGDDYLFTWSDYWNGGFTEQHPAPIHYPDCELAYSLESCEALNSLDPQGYQGQWCEFSGGQCGYSSWLTEKLELSVVDEKKAFESRLPAMQNFCHQRKDLMLYGNKNSGSLAFTKPGCYVRMTSWPLDGGVCSEDVQWETIKGQFEEADGSVSGRFFATPNLVRVISSGDTADRRVPGYYRFIPCLTPSDHDSSPATYLPHAGPGVGSIGIHPDLAERSLGLAPIDPQSTTSEASVLPANFDRFPDLKLQCPHKNSYISRIEFPRLVKLIKNYRSPPIPMRCELFTSERECTMHSDQDCLWSWSDSSCGVSPDPKLMHASRPSYKQGGIYHPCKTTFECSPSAVEDHSHAVRCVFDPWLTLKKNLGNPTIVRHGGYDFTARYNYYIIASEYRWGRCMRVTFARRSDGPVDEFIETVNLQGGENCITSANCASKACLFVGKPAFFYRNENGALTGRPDDSVLDGERICSHRPLRLQTKPGYSVDLEHKEADGEFWKTISRNVVFNSASYPFPESEIYRIKLCRLSPSFIQEMNLRFSFKDLDDSNEWAPCTEVLAAYDTDPTTKEVFEVVANSYGYPMHFINAVFPQMALGEQSATRPFITTLNSQFTWPDDFHMPLTADFRRFVEFVDDRDYRLNPEMANEWASFAAGILSLAKNSYKINSKYNYQYNFDLGTKLDIFERQIHDGTFGGFFRAPLYCRPDDPDNPDTNQLTECNNPEVVLNAVREKRMHDVVKSAVGWYVGYSCHTPASSGVCVDCPAGISDDVWGGSCFDESDITGLGTGDTAPITKDSYCSARLSFQNPTSTVMHYAYEIPQRFPRVETNTVLDCTYCPNTAYCQNFNVYDSQGYVSSEARQFACMNVLNAFDVAPNLLKNHECREVPRFTFASGNQDFDALFDIVRDRIQSYCSSSGSCLLEESSSNPYPGARGSLGQCINVEITPDNGGTQTTCERNPDYHKYCYERTTEEECTQTVAFYTNPDLGVTDQKEIALPESIFCEWTGQENGCQYKFRESPYYFNMSNKQVNSRFDDWYYKINDYDSDFRDKLFQTYYLDPPISRNSPHVNGWEVEGPVQNIFGFKTEEIKCYNCHEGDFGNLQFNVKTSGRYFNMKEHVDTSVNFYQTPPSLGIFYEGDDVVTDYMQGQLVDYHNLYLAWSHVKSCEDSYGVCTIEEQTGEPNDAPQAGDPPTIVDPPDCASLEDTYSLSWCQQQTEICITSSELSGYANFVKTKCEATCAGCTAPAPSPPPVSHAEGRKVITSDKLRKWIDYFAGNQDQVFEGKGVKYTNLFFQYSREGRDCRESSTPGCYVTAALGDTAKNPPGATLSNVPKKCMFCPGLQQMSGAQLLSGEGCNVREGGRCMSTEMCAPALECIFQMEGGGYGSMGTCAKRRDDVGFVYVNTTFSGDPADLGLAEDAVHPFKWSEVQYCDNALGNGYAPTLEPTEYPTFPGDEIVGPPPPTPEPTSFAEFYAAESKETRQSLETIFIVAVLAMLVGACSITMLVQLTKGRDKLTLSQKNNELAQEELEEDLAQEENFERPPPSAPPRPRKQGRMLGNLNW